MKKKLISALVLCALLLGSAPIAAARVDERIAQATQYADILFAQQLFKGTQEGYELARGATRAEAMTMLVRALGAEQEAAAYAQAHGFTDVADWAAPAVGYAVAQGYTKGISATEFGSTAAISDAQYLTLCLRALGFQEGEAFTWDNPYPLALAQGLMQEGEFPVDEFLRADLVTLSYRTLLLRAEQSGYSIHDVTIPSQEGYPLQGTLTIPHGEVRSVIVLIHGSGPSNRNESALANHPFLDLAQGLAARGVAVLRYDKVTYTYGKEISQSAEYARFTFDEESTYDAVNAVAWLAAREDVPQRIYLLGHSLGATVLGRAALLCEEQGTPVAGLISLGGTPRQLWELSREQNESVIADLKGMGAQYAAQVAQSEALVEFETQKALSLADMTAQEALTAPTVFGMPAYYLWHMGQFSAVDDMVESGLPVLILHGGRDRQVSQTDYDLWQTGLAKTTQATFCYYPTLNHLFGEYQGEPVPFLNLMQEYSVRTPVAAEVIDDIAQFAA